MGHLLEGVLFTTSKFIIIAVFVLAFDHVIAKPEHEPTIDQKEELSIFWPQFGSLLIPGFGQAVQGRYQSSLTYLGIAAGGSMMGDKLPHGLAFSFWVNSGSSSLYDSFHKAVLTRKDEFLFIDRQEQFDKLILAPLEFRRFLDETTYFHLLPLFLWSLYGTKIIDRRSGRAPSGKEFISSTGTSFTAGYSEELIFRGWILPILHSKIGNAVMANILQGFIFGALHSRDFVPVPQMLGGIYLGWLTQKNHYSLRESIFVHFWWDFLLLISHDIHYKLRGKTLNNSIPPVLSLTIPI